MFILFISLLFSHPDNILPNSSFEEWIDTLGIHRPKGWMTSEYLRPGSAVEDSESHTGELAIRLFDADSSAFAMTSVPVFAESTYYFSGWAKTTNLIAGSFILTWLKMSQQPIDSVIIIPIVYSLNYREYTKNVVAPESAQFVVVNITSLPGMAILADDITLDGPGWSVEEKSKIKIQNSKLRVSPNPFTQKTTITVEEVPIKSGLSTYQLINLSIHDLSGRLIKVWDLGFGPELDSGLDFHEVVWDGTNENGIKMGSGVYFCLLKLENQLFIDKIIKL